MSIKDKYGRTFRKLRVSLTNACNFGCVYCVNGDSIPGLKNSFVSMNYTELAETVIRLNEILEFTSIRLTGGEPMLYKDLFSFIELLSSNGIENIKMTTNGFFLKEKSKELSKCRVREINVSLDAVDPETFSVISKRKNLHQVKDGIDAALDSGILVKLNSVIMRSINESQILPLLEFAISKNISLRFLELMRMGHLYSKDFMKYFFPMNEILNVIQSEHFIIPCEREPSATARYWQVENGYEFGIIANESMPFCSDCDRLRLDSAGNIYGCLSENSFENISDPSEDENLLKEKLSKALLHKQQFRFKGSAIKMISIGG